MCVCVKVSLAALARYTNTRLSLIEWMDGKAKEEEKLARKKKQIKWALIISHIHEREMKLLLELWRSAHHQFGRFFCQLGWGTDKILWSITCNRNTYWLQYSESSKAQHHVQKRSMIHGNWDKLSHNWEFVFRGMYFKIHTILPHGFCTTKINSELVCMMWYDDDGDWAMAMLLDDVHSSC